MHTKVNKLLLQITINRPAILSVKKPTDIWQTFIFSYKIYESKPTYTFYIYSYNIQ